ncbi:MAG TPA: hypothetical protein VMW70_01330 [Burkholderiales bacterium]|nr:hypothetical protein [Burkholderiales bacterium]
MRHSLALLLSTLVLLSCATDPRGPSERGETSGEPLTPEGAILVEPNIRVERDGTAVIYRGSLTENGLAALQRTGNDPNVNTLVIESTGGEIVVGMDFGIWVINSNLDVVVDHSCLSSCANYVFTAGRNKAILPGAVVAWHGSAKQPGLLEHLHAIVEQQIDASELSPRARKRELKQAQKANIRYLTNAIYKQDQFFYRLGIDEYVTRVGNEKYGVRGFFYLSVPDMAAFGIENVSAPDDYAEMEPRALTRRVGFPVTLVRLE